MLQNFFWRRGSTPCATLYCSPLPYHIFLGSYLSIRRSIKHKKLFPPSGRRRPHQVERGNSPHRSKVFPLLSYVWYQRPIERAPLPRALCGGTLPIEAKYSPCILSYVWYQRPIERVPLPRALCGGTKKSLACTCPSSREGKLIWFFQPLDGGSSGAQFFESLSTGCCFSI